MDAYAVFFGTSRERRYLAQADAAGEPSRGWRPLVWVRDTARAEKFASAQAARDFARERLPHGLWHVGRVPSRGLPTDDLGGSPAALRVA